MFPLVFGDLGVGYYRCAWTWDRSLALGFFCAQRASGSNMRLSRNMRALSDVALFKLANSFGHLQRFARRRFGRRAGGKLLGRKTPSQSWSEVAGQLLPFFLAHRRGMLISSPLSRFRLFERKPTNPSASKRSKLDWLMADDLLLRILGT